MARSADECLFYGDNTEEEPQILMERAEEEAKPEEVPEPIDYSRFEEMIAEMKGDQK